MMSKEESFIVFCFGSERAGGGVEKPVRRQVALYWHCCVMALKKIFDL